MRLTSPETPRSRALVGALGVLVAGVLWTLVVGGGLRLLLGPVAASLLTVAGLVLLPVVFVHAFLARQFERRDAALAQLEAARDQYRSYFDESGEVFFACDPSGRFRMINRAGRELLGLDPVEERLSLFSVVAPEDAVHMSEIAGGTHGGDDVRHFSLDLLTGDGTRVPVQATIRVVRDEDGVVERIRGLFRVVADERDSLQANRSRAAQFKTLIDNLPEGIALLDGDSRVLLTNPPGDALLSEYGTYLAEDRLVLFGGISIERLLEQAGTRLRQELVTREPYHQILEVFGQHLSHDDPSAAAALLVIRDVTAERQRRERLERNDRLAAVGQLAAGIAHDFKNILQGINLCADLSRSPDLHPAELKDNMLTIVEQTERGSKLIQQIMDFTRQSESTQRLLDLGELLVQTTDLLSKGLPENIELSLNVPDGDYPAMVDPGQIQQAVANLVLNARDAMPEGGEIRISLTAVGGPEDQGPVPTEIRDGHWLRIAVADTGTGIPRSVQHRVFEPFFTTKRTGSGTGLGLAQVYGNVQQHGGHVDFETTVGVGTTFFIFLPAYHHHRPADQEPRAAADCPRGNGQTVLVVEDELAVLNATSQSLRSLGYRVLEAVDGRDALRLFEETEQVHLLLTDIRMPGMDGRSLSAEIRRRDARVKVVLMTAYAPPWDGKEGRPPGIDGMLTKPFSLELLATTVHQTLLPLPHDNDDGGVE